VFSEESQSLSQWTQDSDCRVESHRVPCENREAYFGCAPFAHDGLLNLQSEQSQGRTDDTVETPVVGEFVQEDTEKLERELSVKKPIDQILFLQVSQCHQIRHGLDRTALGGKRLEPTVI
jgi:hypothetical protein